MVILGVFFLALGMLVHLLGEQVDEDDHAAQAFRPVRIRSKNPCSDPKTPALVRRSGRRLKTRML
jgi:hypothetical protein